jgi:glycosyltransferase involved in cell wall biosynthesis
MPEPTLSIVMPVYNAAPYIREAVQSLLDQTYKDFELIVVDDGCTDESINIIEEFGDERIRILRNERNSGIVFSRNRGTAAAHGRYIAPFDADDIARKDKFEKQIAFLEKNPDFAMLGSWVKIIDEQGRPAGRKWKVNAPPEKIPAILLFRNYFAQSAMVIRREVLPEGYYSEGYDVVEDYKMWIDITSRYKAWNYPDYLLLYRVHSLSATNFKAQRMIERDKMIFRYIYQKLEIEPDEGQLSLLIALKNGNSFENAQRIKELHNFLELIIKRNRKLHVYDQSELARVVYNRFVKACFNQAGNPFPNIMTCISGRLFRELLRSFFRYGRLP